MASRSLDDLKFDFSLKAQNFIYACEDAGLQILVYCTQRGFDEQAALYCRGRNSKSIEAKAVELRDVYKRPGLAKLLTDKGPLPGRIVTRAGPGQSLHGYGYAFDCVPLLSGKPVWGINTPAEKLLWAKLGRLGTQAGMEWAGYWQSFKEFPHFQKPNIRWQDLI